MPASRALSRSEQMSRIRRQDTEPERRLRSALWADGLRFRVHFATPGSRPDVVFPRKRVAVFVDGCFWHGCPSHYVRPRSRLDHWARKLRTNVERDRRQILELERLGWYVMRVWEHQVYEGLPEVVQRVREALEGSRQETAPDWRVVSVEAVDELAHTERRHLEQLRCSETSRMEEGRRITSKWRGRLTADEG
jgi:DNA mismatch endonuclease, patch repair protein